MLWLVFVEWLSRIIFLGLVLLSIWSVSIILDRYRFFKSIKLPGENLRKNIRDKNFFPTPDYYISDFLLEIKQLKSSESIDKAFDAYATNKKMELEKGLPILGTLGSTTPFVGLLGTILGIIVSFGELSQGAGSTNSVMFSLAEALVLTAAGLVVAIPAVVAYNYFGRKAKYVLTEAQSLKDLYLAYRE
jgi:biopolymer transport protein ExbB